MQVLGHLEVFVGHIGVINAQEEGDFADTIGTVVEEETGVIVCTMSGIMELRRMVMQTLQTALVAVDNNRLQELVVLALLVLFFDLGYGILGSLAVALDKPLQRDRDTLPSLVTVHGVVSMLN
jgi:hypothetical protein